MSDGPAVWEVAGGALSIGVALYVGIVRYAINQREKEIDRRIGETQKSQATSSRECTRELRSLADRLTTEEKATIRQDGEIRLVNQNHDSLTSDIEEIKRTMVTKSEWEPRMTALERNTNQILAELRSGSGRYSPVRQPPPISDPPKKT